MAFNKVRYVTVCQQFLTTAVVLALGATAASVLTLEIESPQQSVQAQRTPTQEHSPRPSAGGADGTPVRDQSAPAPADVRPVQPKVREVAVTSVAEKRPESQTRPEARAKRTVPAPGPVEDPAVQEGVSQDRSIVAVSEPEKVTGFATVGVTWKDSSPVEEDDLRIEVRTREDGRWSDWSEAEFHDEHAPDAPEGDVARGQRAGTDALVIGDVDEVQMRATSRSGAAPEDVNLAIIDPGVGREVEQEPQIDTAKLAKATTRSARVQPSSAGEIALSASISAPQPKIYSRAQWGANERMRDGRPRYGTIRTGFVHHTVNANNYTASQVPALIRGIYAYHTQSRGWSDIGYNFLVDRFGRIWEGRYGGVDKAVIGAHTLGYNEYSFAMSAIGNFETARPNQRVVDAYASLFAWKLSLYDIPADATGIRLKKKTFQAINGHRDAGSTACPGRYLYAKLPEIRSGASAVQKTGAVPPPAYEPLAAPQEAVAQPRGLTFPRSHNLVGDATPDLVAQDSSGALRVFRGEAAPAFSPAIASAASYARFRGTYMVGDLNRDGRPELINQTRSGAAAIFPGKANGTYNSKARKRTGTWRFKHLNGIAGIGDLNRDGRQDLVGIDRRNGRLYLAPGKPRWRFGKLVRLRAPWARNAVKLHTVGDLTGDGRQDLVFTNRNGNAKLIAVTGTEVGRPKSLPRVANGVFRGHGDLNSDGIADLVFSRGGDWFAFPGQGRGRFASTPWGPIPGPALGKAWIAPRFVGSPQADIVGIDGSGRPLVAAHNGGRGVGQARAATGNIGPSTAILSVGDWNGDGRNDLITRHRDGDLLKIHLGNGNGTFRKRINMGSGWKDVTYLTAGGDVTGDGKPDLIGQVGNTPVRIWPGDGGTGFQAPQWAPAKVVTFASIGSAAWRTGDMPGSMFPSPNGTFVPVAGISERQTGARKRLTSGYDLVLGLGDWDGDGSDDVIARRDGVLWLLPGSLKINSTGTPRFLGTGFNYRAMG